MTTKRSEAGSDAPPDPTAPSGGTGAADTRRVPPLMTAAWETAIADPDPLVALGATRALASLLTTWESQLVGEAVAEGATWEAIGGTVGVSRQAAWQRFHHDVHGPGDRARAEAHELRQRHRQEMHEFRDRLRQEAEAFRGRRGRRSRPSR